MHASEHNTAQHSTRQRAHTVFKRNTTLHNTYTYTTQAMSFMKSCEHCYHHDCLGKIKQHNTTQHMEQSTVNACASKNSCIHNPSQHKHNTSQHNTSTTQHTDATHTLRKYSLAHAFQQTQLNQTQTTQHVLNVARA
jgi:hypothetical protein